MRDGSGLIRSRYNISSKLSSIIKARCVVGCPVNRERVRDGLNVCVGQLGLVECAQRGGGHGVEQLGPDGQQPGAVRNTLVAKADECQRPPGAGKQRRDNHDGDEGNVDRCSPHGCPDCFAGLLAFKTGDLGILTGVVQAGWRAHLLRDAGKQQDGEQDADDDHERLHNCPYGMMRLRLVSLVAVGAVHDDCARYSL